MNQNFNDWPYKGSKLIEKNDLNYNTIKSKLDEALNNQGNAEISSKSK